MGKIQDRIAAARAAANRTGKPVKAGIVGNAITKVWFDEAGPPPDKSKKKRQAPAQIDQATAKRVADLSRGLQRAYTAGIDTMERHELMQELAAEAKSLGLKGKWNLLCNRTQCLHIGATWYNRGSHAFYCPDCADMLNNDSFNGRDAERLFGPGQKLCVFVATEEEAAKLHVSA